MKRILCHTAVAIVVSVISVAAVHMKSLRLIAALNQSQPEQRLFPTIIIDPGHGGEDGGASSGNGFKESDLNLSIAKKLNYVLVFCGVDTVMTRTEEMIEYPNNASTVRQRKNADMKRRADLANSYSNAAFVSIHQNKYSTNQAHGAQVLYSSVSGSKELAETIQNNLILLDKSNRRTAISAPDSLYLIRTVKCPTIIVECGFLSNEHDLSKLTDSEYQCNTAAAIACALISRYK